MPLCSGQKVTDDYSKTSGLMPHYSKRQWIMPEIRTMIADTVKVLEPGENGRSRAGLKGPIRVGI